MFNNCGWTLAKYPDILRLAQAADLTCLTETWVHQEPLLPSGLFAYHAYGHRTARSNRYSGGVCLLLLSPNFTHQASIEEPCYQIVAGSLSGLATIGAYLKPRTPPATAQCFFFHLTRLCHGKNLVLGDFNGRHRTWDIITKCQGRILA